MLSITLNSILLGGLVYLIFVLNKFRDRAIGTRKRQDPSFPNLPGWPLLGQLPLNLWNANRPLESCTITSLKYRPGFSFTLPGVRFIDISKPEWLEYIQKTNFKNYVKGPLIRSVLEDVFGHGVFAVDGDLWKRSRQVTSSLFSVHTFKNIMVPAANKSMDRLVQVLQSAADQDRSVDFCQLMYCFTLESFILMTFGKDLELLGQDSSKKTDISSGKKVAPLSSLSFASAFDFTQDQMDFRLEKVFAWRLIEKLNFRLGQKMKASCRTLDEYAYSLIDEKLSHSSPSTGVPENEKAQHDLLEILMNAMDERGHSLGRKELRDNLLNLIIAGRDTTAQALSWSFFHLIMNPDIVSKIRNETINILGAIHEEDPERVTYDNYKRFTWAYSAALETLRLHPSVPKNAKFAVAADKIPRGPFVEAGDCLRWSGWQMARDPELWGADCGEFRPDRWIDPSGNLNQCSPFKFPAFNGGHRLCLGMNLAIFEIVKVLVETFWKFELKFSEGWFEKVPKSERLEGIPTRYQTPMYRVSLTLPMKEPMMISVRLRESANPPL